MDYHHFRVSVIVTGCVYCLSYSSQASANHISLKKAMASKLVTVGAVSTGGYCGKSIRLFVKNNTRSELLVDIDPGLIFKPEDTSYQDLVLLGNESIALAPATSRDMQLQTFCGKSYGSGPGKGLVYNYWKQGDSNMVNMLRYVKANRIDISLAQKAVWSFTNGHSVNSIYASDRSAMSEEFAKYVARLKKVKLPQYYVDYKLDNTAGQRVIMAQTTKVYAIMHWRADEGYRNMHLAVYKENGQVYKVIEADQVIDKYGHTVKVQFDPKVDPKGVYLVTLYDDAKRIWDQKKVVVGGNEYVSM